MNKVLTAMSGGVDSSAGALLVRDRGCEAVGATMRLIDTMKESDIADARSVCERLGLKHYVFDMREEFAREVLRRFADAYPDVIYRTERINARLAAVKAETERLRREAEQRLAERRDQVADRLEPSTLIKSSVIDRQSALIELLYDDATATDEMKALKATIDRDRERLASRPLGRIATARKGS